MDYASFTLELYVILQEPDQRLLSLNTQVNHFFPNTTENYITHKKLKNEIYTALQSILLNEPLVKYTRIEIVTEEDPFVRSYLFKRYIPQVYNDTCAVNGMQIRSIYNYNFIDASHIVAFSISNDDKVTNVPALCPNIHRAIDLDLIAIDDNYHILISEAIKDESNHP